MTKEELQKELLNLKEQLRAICPEIYDFIWLTHKDNKNIFDTLTKAEQISIIDINLKIAALYETLASYDTKFIKDYIMIREEEIEKAAKQYIDNKLNLNKSITSAFINGVEWADEHPNLESLWHNANEEPNIEYEIICQDDSENYRVTNIKEVKYQYQNGWQECVASNYIVRWAYIKDLLPKEGEK